MTHLGFKKFAIFAPTSNYGTSSANAFTTAVEARGGTIVIREDYDPVATDLIPNAEKLGRKDYESRKLEFKNLQKETEESGGKASRVVLPPVIDFDAIFVPDSARRIPIACAALAYEEFAIGTFRPRKGEEPVPLLGLSSWNNSSLLNNGGKYVRGSYFTDVYLASSDRSQSFIEAFRAQFSRSPSALEVITYDTGLILRRAMEKAPTNRLLMLDALHKLEFDGAVTGAIGFEEDSRETRFDIKILTIEEDEILVVNPTDAIENPEESENGDSNPE